MHTTLVIAALTLCSFSSALALPTPPNVEVARRETESPSLGRLLDERQVRQSFGPSTDTTDNDIGSSSNNEPSSPSGDAASASDGSTPSNAASTRSAARPSAPKSTSDAESASETDSQASATQSLSRTKFSSASSTSSTGKAKHTGVTTNGTIDNGDDIPQACAQGCANAYYKLERCESGDEACTDLCGWISYTYTVDCLNCLVSFGTPGVNATKANDMLEQISDLCEDAGKKVLSTGLVTAKPTTTGPLTEFRTDIAQTTTASTIYAPGPTTGAAASVRALSRGAATGALFALLGVVLL